MDAVRRNENNWEQNGQYFQPDSNNWQVVRKTGQVYTEINIAKLNILALHCTALHSTGIVWVLEEK